MSAARARAPALLALLSACAPAPEPARPDVVVVVLDTLRPDHLALFGYARATAPWLAQLGRRAAVFDAACSTSSWTAPATASVFTGLYPTRHGVVPGLLSWRVAGRGERERPELERLPSDVPTPPELLRQHGYRTFGVSSNPNVAELLGFTRGFERFASLRGQHGGDTAGIEGVLDGWEEELRAAHQSFLYLHFMDTHAPLEGRAPWYAEQSQPLDDEIARYDSESAYVDRHLAALSERFGWGRDTRSRDGVGAW